MANEVIINVKSNTTGAQKGLKDMNKSLKTFGDNARKAGMAFAAVGAIGVVAIKGFLDAALEQQRSTQLLASSIENLGISYDSVRHDIEKTTSALQAKTNFGDEEQMRALALMIPMLGSVDKAMAALPAVMDAASLKGVSLSTVAGTLTRALSGQVNTAITLGMAFDETADFGERLEQVLDAIAGAAEASANPLTQLNNDIGDLKEKMGFALLPIMDPVIQKTREWTLELQEVDEQTLQTTAKVLAIGTAIGVVGGAFLLFVSFIPAITAGFLALGVSAAVLAGATGIGLILVAVAGLALAWNTDFMNIQSKTTYVVDALGIEFDDLLTYIGPHGSLISALKNLDKEFEVSWSLFGSRGKEWGSWLKDQFGLTEGAQEFFQPAIDKVKEFGEEFADAGKEIATFEHNMGIHMSAAANDIGKVEEAANRAANAIANMFPSGWDPQPGELYGGPGFSWSPEKGIYVPSVGAQMPGFPIYPSYERTASELEATIANQKAALETLRMNYQEGVSLPNLISLQIDGVLLTHETAHISGKETIIGTNADMGR
jgi:hypothetical protein